MNRILLRKLIIFLLYLLTSGLVLFVFDVYPGFDGNAHIMFPDMVYGKAYKPYVLRTLLPGAVRAVAEVTPDTVKDRVNPSLEKRMHLLHLREWDERYTYEYFVALLLMLSCFVGLAYTLRHLTAWFYDYPAFVGDLAPVGGLLVLPVFFKYYSYIYDPGTLLLFSLAVASIVARKRLLFYLLFVLASFNKETSILLCGLFFLYEYPVMRKSVLIGHLLGQLSLWVAIRAFLVFIFRNNPGPWLEFHLTHIVDVLRGPIASLRFVGIIAVMWLLTGYGWARKPAFLRKGLLVTLIPLAVLAVFFGFVDELRDYYEAFPFLFLLWLPTIVEAFGLSAGREPANTSQSRLGS